MTHVGIVLTGSPFDSQRWRTAYELGRAALADDHEVTVFHYLDGVYVPIEGQEFPDGSTEGLYGDMPTEKFQELMEEGVEVICCGLCIDARGIDADAAYPEGIKVGLLSDLADLLGEADRVISL